MEVWVRSQDRTKFLVCDNLRVDDILIELSKTQFKKAIPNYMEIKSVIYAGSTLLGRYDTKERCLEIIDEIQKLLCQTTLVVRNLDGKPTLDIEQHEQSVVVYEMPKE